MSIYFHLVIYLSLGKRPLLTTIEDDCPCAIPFSCNTSASVQTSTQVEFPPTEPAALSPSTETAPKITDSIDSFPKLTQESTSTIEISDSTQNGAENAPPSIIENPNIIKPESPKDKQPNTPTASTNKLNPSKNLPTDKPQPTTQHSNPTEHKGTTLGAAPPPPQQHKPSPIKITKPVIVPVETISTADYHGDMEEDEDCIKFPVVEPSLVCLLREDG